jgi:cell wall-associated NlpC family hydrolase
MTTGLQVVSCAREYLETPYKHQGRKKGVGIDCIGLPICICQDLRLSTYNNQNYGEAPAGMMLIERISTQCTAIKKEFAIDGDLLVFRINRLPQHCGILASKGTRKTLIHAYQGCDRVKEHTYTSWWSDRLTHAFRLPGVNNG